jgi:hypothetical protein
MSISLLTWVVTPLVAALGLWFSYHVVRGIRTGTANVHNDLVRRSQRPVYYWTAVLVQATFATVLLFYVARVLSR